MPAIAAENSSNRVNNLSYLDLAAHTVISLVVIVPATGSFQLEVALAKAEARGRDSRMRTWHSASCIPSAVCRKMPVKARP